MKSLNINIGVVDKGGYYEVYEDGHYQMNIQAYWLDKDSDIIYRYLKEVNRLDLDEDEEI